MYNLHLKSPIIDRYQVKFTVKNQIFTWDMVTKSTRKTFAGCKKRTRVLPAMSRPIYHHGNCNSILSCGRKSLRQDRDSRHGRIRSKLPPSGDKYSVRGGSRLKWNDLWGSSWETLAADGSSNGLTFIQIGHRCCPYCPCCRYCRYCQWGPKNVTPSGTNPTKPSLYRFYSTTLKWNCLIRLIFFMLTNVRSEIPLSSFNWWKKRSSVCCWIIDFEKAL